MSILFVISNVLIFSFRATTLTKSESESVSDLAHFGRCLPMIDFSRSGKAIGALQCVCVCVLVYRDDDF